MPHNRSQQKPEIDRAGRSARRAALPGLKGFPNLAIFARPNCFDGRSICFIYSYHY